MIKLVRVVCCRCNTMFQTPLVEIGLHVDQINGGFMCPKCCKDEHWFTEERCGSCSEKTMCKGLFLPNLKKSLERTKGV